MREIRIKYNKVTIDEVVVELARYVEQGYHIVGCSIESTPCYGEDKYTIELVKH